jgi:hypothetical protein
MADKVTATKTRAARKKTAGAAADGRRGGMTKEHKAALAVGREQGRMVKAYLEALERHRPTRGRKRTPDSISKRITRIDTEMEGADALRRLQLVQERMDLEGELARSGQRGTPVEDLQDAFIEVARDYSQRKGVSYAAWRELGVDASVLKRAGITRTQATL